MSNSLSPVSIKYLDRETIGKISAGKVIPSLANVVKELIENALDAHATYIELRFVDYGKDLIEVSDDGCGIQEDDFSNLALPHYTSKLKHYRDLGAIKSFGFRGEALASIAELSNLTIITRHGSKEIASELSFNNLGELISIKPTARPVGTTVRIRNLFYSYPVRRKEFETTYVKQFNSMMQFIYPYALGFTDLRLVVTNHINGRKNEVLNIEPKSIKDNIIQLLGCKQMKTIQPFVQHPIKDEVASEFKLSAFKEEEKEIKITGYVSHGDKAPSKLKKVYFFLNRRPANYAPMEKLILSVYREINQTINPFVLLFVDLGNHEIDFSVHPDKRTFSLPKENLLFAILKSSLLTMFETNTVSLDSVKPSSLSSSQNKSGQSSSLQKLANKRSIEDEDEDNLPELDEDELRSLNMYVHTTTLRCSSPADSYMRSSPAPRPNQEQSTPVRPVNTSLDHHTQNLGNLRREDLNTSDESEIPPDTGIYNPVRNILRNLEEIDQSRDENSFRANRSDEGFSLFRAQDRPPKYPSDKESNSNRTLVTSGLRSLTQFSFNKRRKKDQDNSNQVSVRDIFSIVPRQKSTEDLNLSTDNVNLNLSAVSDSTIHGEMQSTMIIPRKSSSSNLVDNLPPVPGCSQIPKEVISVDLTAAIISNFPDQEKQLEAQKPTDERGKDANRSIKIIADEPMVGLTKKRIKFDTTNISPNKLADFYAKLRTPLKAESSRLFTKLAHNTDQTQAEDELKREMQKEAFGEMEIIGQFNKAFIIAKLDCDVFIIDQHASDERYNFEDLLENTVLESQRLVNPIPLQLTCYQESIVASNLKTFEKLSFKIEINEKSRPGSKTSLVCVPISQDAVFGKAEIEEILSQIEETGSACYNFKPEKMVRMIATRACHKSIRINDSLDNKRMRTVLDNLIKLKNPWICAHGRPTIRFLFNIFEIKFQPKLQSSNY